MNIKQLEKLRNKLKCNLSDVIDQICEIKRIEKEEIRQGKIDKTRALVERVLNGESPTVIAKSLGVTTPSVQGRIRNFCWRLNRDVYESGINHGSTNNYLTPSLKHLRENKVSFGF